MVTSADVFATVSKISVKMRETWRDFRDKGTVMAQQEAYVYNKHLTTYKIQYAGSVYSEKILVCGWRVTKQRSE